MSFARVARLAMAGVAVISLAAVQPASAQMTVFDPSNYAQNVMTAARSLQQVNNQIRSLENQATSLINQAKNLASLPYSTLVTIQNSIQQTQQLLNQAQRIAYSVTQIDQAFTRYYPQGYSGSPSNTQLIGDAQTRWTNALAGYQDALHVQAGVVGNITATQSPDHRPGHRQPGRERRAASLAVRKPAAGGDRPRAGGCHSTAGRSGPGRKFGWRRDDRQPGASSVPDHHLPDHGRGLPAAARHDVPLMRRPALNARSLGRTGAVLLVAGAISAAAISIHSADRSRAHAAATAASSRTVNAGLERCRDLGTAAENDPECLAIWAQLRRHFFESKPPAGGRP